MRIRVCVCTCVVCKLVQVCSYRMRRHVCVHVCVYVRKIQ